MEKLHHLHGMHDLPQKCWRPLRAIQDDLREHFSLHGYQVLETPVLEPTELFLRKSGGELAARMYTFTDPGGNQVSLRPEYTASILRYYLEGNADESLPMRVQYAGPVFRYEEDGASYRQFTQAGAEILGSPNPRADAEILALSWLALSRLGISGHRLEIGDLGVIYSLLESLELSERAVAFILGGMTELREGEEGFANVQARAKQLRLLPSDSQQSDPRGAEHLSAAMGSMDEGQAKELLLGLLQWAEVGSLGQREPLEVVERLLRKFRGTDAPEKLERGLEMANRLAKVRGEPEACLREANDLIESSGFSPSSLDRLKEVMSLLDVDQLQDAGVVLDFGLIRGLAYYTGIVFEITYPALGTSLGGGGRYDALARALGSPSNIPALGFAYTLEHLLDALNKDGHASLGGESAADRILVLAPTRKAYGEGLRLAQELRSKGTPAEMEVCGMDVEESLSYARAKGIKEIITVDDAGKGTTLQVHQSPTRGGPPEHNRRKR